SSVPWEELTTNSLPLTSARPLTPKAPAAGPIGPDSSVACNHAVAGVLLSSSPTGILNRRPPNDSVAHRLPFPAMAMSLQNAPTEDGGNSWVALIWRSAAPMPTMAADANSPLAGEVTVLQTHRMPPSPLTAMPSTEGLGRVP